MSVKDFLPICANLAGVNAFVTNSSNAVIAPSTPETVGHRHRNGRLWRGLAYYLGVPLSVAIYAGLNNWQMQEIAGFPATILFYLAHSLLPWWLTCGSTHLWMKLLAHWKPAWLVLLLLGHVTGCLLVLPYSNWLTTAFEIRWPSLTVGPEFGPLLSAEFWGYLLRAGIIWIGVNVAFDRFVGLPLYRYAIPRGYDEPANEAVTLSAGGTGSRTVDGHEERNTLRAALPAFLSRLPARLELDELLAIKAEQHYIRVYTPNREYMVLYRFSDAIRELDNRKGVQVHRSYWVNTASVASICTRAKDFHLSLASGAKIPVSIPYQGMVRELARTERWPVRG
jgi:LytTr DNA-binding domain